MLHPTKFTASSRSSSLAEAALSRSGGLTQSAEGSGHNTEAWDGPLRDIGADGIAGQRLEGLDLSGWRRALAEFAPPWHALLPADHRSKTGKKFQVSSTAIIGDLFVRRQGEGHFAGLF